MAKYKKLDLATLDTRKYAEQGAPLELVNPGDGIPLGITINLAGGDSDVYQRHFNSRANRNSKLISRGRDVTREQIDEDVTFVLAHCTLSWSGVVVDGEELPCNVENAKKLYDRFPWIREQVNAFILDRKNFLAG